MPSATIIAESYSFFPSQLLELWELDGTAIGLNDIYRFVNTSSYNSQPVVFNGITYTPFPIKVEGMERDGKGSLPRPRLTVSNINGFVSALLLGNEQLVGATVSRTRVFARFIDAVNFPTNQPLPSWVTPDPTASYPAEPFKVNRKITENPQIVSWELASPLEVHGVKLPRRQIIANSCSWRYREAGTCDYSGPPVADKANRSFVDHYGLTLNDAGSYDEFTTYNAGDYVTIFSTLPQFSGIPIVYVCLVNGTVGKNPIGDGTNWRVDTCTKTIAGCKLRYTDTPLRTSAFIGCSRAGWIARSR